MLWHKDKYFLKSSKKAANANIFAIVCFVIFGVILCLSPSNPAHAKSSKKYAAYVMDADTGFILHRENATRTRYPASLTKMMTLLLTFEALDRGDLTLYTRVRISEHAASMIPSKIGLKPGSTIKVRDAIHALSTKSANDIAVALAEKLGGTEANFAKMMTQKARELGMTKTRFKNASGLHDPGQISTARDMAKLGHVLVTEYKHHYHYFSKKKFTYQGKTYRSHNKLMDSYVGMDGLKTGYIRQSGFNLVASAERNNRRIIAVVLGGKTSKSRNKKMEELLDLGFAKLDDLLIANASIPIPERKPKNVDIAVAGINHYDQPFLQHEDQRTRMQKRISRWDMLSNTYENSVFERMIGQGDYDISVRNRIETGLIAISSHMGETVPNYVFDNDNIKPIEMSRIPPQPTTERGDWSIQIGAFTSRDRTDKAIISSLEALPTYLRHAQTTIAPLQTEQGWIFRGRLHGYTEESAKDACRILADCIEISPKRTYQ